jgi:hypothetical protein
VLWQPIFWISYSLWMYPQLNGTRSPADLMTGVAKRTGPGAELALPDFDEEFLLQARQPSVHFGRETALVAQLARAYSWLSEAPGSRWMLIEQRRRIDLACAALEQAIDLGHQNRDDWWLIPGTAFAGCRGDTAAAPLFLAPTTAVAARGSSRGPPASTRRSDAPTRCCTISLPTVHGTWTVPIQGVTSGQCLYPLTLSSHGPGPPDRTYVAAGLRDRGRDLAGPAERRARAGPPTDGAGCEAVDG